ncbi:hypothetical protein [Vibrio tritonius]|uniref:hypothetical protein n=1 Tax=Vibrio tritonius TaxID=1435069 RepID=UPI00315D61DE
MKKSILVSLLLVPLTACTSSQHEKSFDVKNADFSKASDINLCTVYGAGLNRSLEAKSELIKRSTFTDSEWNNISKHQVTAGMSECAVLASYSASYKSKKSNARQVSITYSCNGNHVPYCPYTKVNFVDGKVTSVYALQEK